VPRVSEQGVRAHLMDKIEEWLELVKAGHATFRSMEEAEQAFKDWLWGTGEHG
jgi:hypothetical protein